ncbi:EAL domain-containing protein [Thiohalomonas denitrificans]|uniref:PAS domain S-box-containing protein/diguanylate cyclase (GGDEF) domain-containing protein n=1 Tax=Thiohalomonas denitrificans TaxID=415747 RepID=A0A1G5QEC9_9GAMM|nr:EAL domain-containing protein [Thiohalomonas denitrificans]SCZ59956.1 PAS domain S-box-containing protein/diguanylate cyclase (GGDEF) domain-containing protein [Thiohalomonas denitrificans]
MSPPPLKTSRSHVVRYAAILALAWTVTIIVLVLWDSHQDRRITEDLAFSEGNIHFDKDQAFRQWVNSHGRIYVPVTEENPPNPYLAHVPEQIIKSPSGQVFTLLNPASTIRQIETRFSKLYGVAGRITGLQPLRPENAPDPWERNALAQLREGAEQIHEFTQFNGQPFLRLMRPMVIQEECLLCHGQQGFEVGEINGGVSISVPMEGYLAREQKEQFERNVSFTFLWLLGLIGIGVGGRRLQVHDHGRVSALEQVRQGEARKRAILDSALDCIITIDGDDRVLEFNPAAERVFGYSRNQIIGRELAEMLIPPHLREYHRQGLRRYLANGEAKVMGRRIETTALRADGETFPVELAITHVERTERPLFTAYIRDISDQVEAEHALRESEERYALAARGANDGLWDWNLVTDRVYYSERYQDLLGLKQQEHTASPEHWLERIHPQDRLEVTADLEAHLADASAHFASEHRVWHEDGAYRWVLARGLAVRDETGKPYRLAGSLSDVTERRVAEEQLRHDAFHDALTGLSNRALFLDHLDIAVRRAQRVSHYRFAVLFLDLDRFKLINDGLGHLAGDELLVTTGRRLAECVRPDDTVARLGGDEFAVLVEDIEELETAEELARQIIDMLSRPVSVGAQRVTTTCSIGIAWSRNSTGYSRGEELLRDADTAMYQAKLQGKARYAVFETGMHLKVLSQLQLENDLRGALDRGELHLAYQPIINLNNGRVYGFEALLRWMHPERGQLSPLDFIPVAEESGLIVPIGRWVLKEACRQLQKWQAQFDPWLSMSINVSPMQFTEASLSETVAKLLQQLQLSPETVKLELTESTLLDNEDVSSRLHALRDLGVGLCIDDFGTGYSAMSYLHRFPVTVLKVDRAFVSRLVSGGKETVATIVALADSLGLEVIAEGVETGIQADLLRTVGCRLVQGHYFSRALSAGEIGSFLEESLWCAGSR